MPELGDSIFEVMKQDESQPFRTSMGQGLEKNPDEVAKHRKIASQLGTSADFVATDPAGMEQAAKKQGFDYDAFIQKSPKLTAWATNPENASLASDDMDNLSGLESAFHRAKRIESDKVRAENYRRGTGVVTGLATSLVRGVDQLISAPQDVAEATTYATIGRAFGPGAAKKFIDTFSPVSPGYWLGQFGRAGEKALKQTDRQTGGILVSDPKTGQTFMNMQAVNPMTPEGLENISKMFMQEAPAFAAQMAVTGMTGGLGGAALAPKAGKLAGLVARVGQYAKSPAGMMEVGRTVSGQYNNAVDQFVSQGMDPEQARVKVAPGALLAGVFSAAAGAPMEAKIMEDLLHRVAVLPGGKSIVQKIAGRLWSATTTGAKEGTQEVLNGVGEDLSEWITYNPDKTIQEAAGNAVMNFVGGAAMGGAGGAAAHGANTQEFIQELSDIAKSSKLNQRASDKFQEAVQSMAGEQENLFIPATQYFQTVTDAGLDPAELAQSLGVSNLQEAMEAGTDVVIPVGAYAAQIAATDLHGKLAQDIRLNPGDATMREETEAGKLAEDEAAKATEDAQGLQVQAEIDALPVPAVEQFRAKRQAQLEAAGFAPDAAAEQARWHAQVFDVLAGSEGLTVEQMDQMFPLEVSGVRSGEGKKSLTDLALDRLKGLGGTVQEFFQRGGGRYASDKEARAARARRAGQNTQASMDKAKMDAHNADEAEFSVFDSAVKELQAGDILNDKRGFIQVTPDRQFHIGLLEGRDLSTFLHESGHYFLEVMGDLAERPEASERVKGMWADTLKSFGVDSREAITTEHHEQFAGQMERYLMEGKAPSEKLKPMFQRFKSWLMLVYKQMDKIGVRINDDVRSVFDRLMATDAEIEAHRPQVETFATAKDMGVSEKEFEIYQKAKAGAMEEGRDRLQGEVMKDLLREQKAAYKEEKAQARADVEVGVDSRPDMKAIVALTDPNNQIKLNRQAVQDQFGDARGLPVVEGGGMDAEAAAEMLGFDSGAQLYQALKDAPARADLIDTLTDEIMFARYGDVTLDGSIADKAVEALKTDKMADVLAMELKAMDRLRNISEKIVSSKNRQDRAAQSAARKSLPTTNSARLAAQAFVSNMSLREMEPNKYDIAERKYRKEAAKLTKKKDYEGAVAAQSRALLNHFLYREAKKGQERVSKVREYVKKGTSNDFQAMLGHAGQVFRDGFNQVIDGYEIARVPNWELDERKAALLKLMEAYGGDVDGEGGGIVFDPMLIERTPKNYREVPLSELNAVMDALKNIETVARLQLEADINGKKVEFGEIRSIFTNWTPEKENTPVYMEGDSSTTLEKARHLVRGLDAMLLKVEWMVDRFDRGDINGPMRTFIKHLVDTSVGKRQDIGYQIHSKIEELAKARDPKHVAKMNDTTTVMFPLRKKPMTYQQISAWALNLGTAENKNVALLGEGLIDGAGTVSPVVDQALALLPASELRFIQGVWDTLETLRQPLADEYRRKTGLTMKLKELTPLTVTSSDGETINLRGGYYPLAASYITNVGKNQADPLSTPGQGRKAGAKVATGMTKEVTGATYQLKLDFSEVLSKHLSDTITNITFGETSQTVNKILNDEDISKALSEKLGKEYVDTLKGWLTDVLERPGDAPPMDPAIKAITEFKSGACVATLAGSIPSVLVQMSDTAKPFFAPGISNLQLVKARYDMSIHHSELIAKIKELSPNVMRHRAENYNREIRDTLTSYGAFDAKSRATAEYLMSAFAAMDREITFPTWLAVYRKGMATHNNEAQAIMEADRIISRTFQAGDPNNMSQMFRSRNGWQRLFTTFQNDGNTWYGIISSSIASKKVGRVSMALMGAFVGQALGQMLKNRGWGDDDDDKKEWVIKQAWLTPIGSMPVFGGALDTALSVSGFGGGGDFTTSVMGRTIKGFAKPFVEWHKNGWDGIDWEDVAIAEAEAVGTVKGIPGVSQAIRSWKYIHKVRTGEETPDGALDFAANTVFGKNPNK